MDWEERLAQLWTSMNGYEEAEFLRKIETLVSELPADDPRGLFEKAASLDSTGHSDLAVPLYQQALDGGLSGERRRRATIQMASSLRNLDRADESARLLEEEKNYTSDHLDDAVNAFLALALVDLGREREAAAIAIETLSRHLPRYNRSVANYAQLLISRTPVHKK